jgi:hypothetical protein
MNDPTRYYDAVRDEEDAAADALRAIRDEQAAGRITVTEAASERCVLLEQHLERLHNLRVTYLGAEGTTS